MTGDRRQLYEAASKKASAGQFAEALVDYDAVLKLAPDDEDALVERAICLKNTGDLRGAIAGFEKALALPRRGRADHASFNCALARERLGDFEGALRDMDRAVQLAPKWPDAYYSRAAYRGHLGDARGAIADYDRCLELLPGHVESLCYRALRRLDLGEWARAIADYERALSLDEKRAGEIRSLLEAARGFEKLDREGPSIEFARACRDLGRNRLERGQAALALLWFERGLARAPGDPELEKGREEALRAAPPRQPLPAAPRPARSTPPAGDDGVVLHGCSTALAGLLVVVLLVLYLLSWIGPRTLVFADAILGALVLSAHVQGLRRSGLGWKRLAGFALALLGAALLASPELAGPIRGWTANSAMDPPVFGPGEEARLSMPLTVRSLQGQWGSWQLDGVVKNRAALGLGERDVTFTSRSWSAPQTIKDSTSSVRTYVDVQLPARDDLAGKSLDLAIHMSVRYPYSEFFAYGYKIGEGETSLDTQVAVSERGAASTYTRLFWAGTLVGLALLVAGGVVLASTE